MANLKISQFTAGVTPTDTDEIAGYLSGGGAGSNRQWQFGQIITYLNGSATFLSGLITALLASSTFIAGIVSLIKTASAVGGGLSGVIRTQGQILATSLNMDQN